MKTLKYYFFVFFVALAFFGVSSCTDNEEPTPEQAKELPNHFDVWVSIGTTSGMGSDNTQLVKSLDSLSSGVLDFNGNGADVTSKLNQETIIKGKYYYQITKNGRFGKYQIVNDQVVVVAEFPFSTLKDRRFTHSWIDDKTLVLMGSNGDSSKILWVKINAETMTIISEGTLDLPAPEGTETFNTSGIANYRDGQILYAYVYNKSTRKHFYVSFINATDMSTEKTVMEDRAEFIASTAYGELLQQKTFFDSKGNYYIACNNSIAGATSTTQQYGTLLRINKGETDFDKSYKGYNYTSGKLVTVDYLNNGKALVYIQDPTHTDAAGWGSDFNCFYAVLDLTTDKLTELELPYCNGTFSQRSIIVGNKAYIGVYPKTGDTAIYIYDTATGKLTKGMTIAPGYAFDRIIHFVD